MNTKVLMAISAIALGALGVILTFAPEEVAHLFDFPDSTAILFQILGALYFGFAMLNWTAKGNLIGGIYGRPVTIGNFTHFLIGGLALIKLVLHNANWTYILACAIFYLIFALLFGWIFFTNPASVNKAA